MATPLTLSTWDWNTVDEAPARGGAAAGRGPAWRGRAGAGRVPWRWCRGPGGGGGGGGGGFGGGAAAGARPRVIMSFPANASEMLLSGSLAGGEALASRAQVVDAPLGTGHVVMFGIRPFWRWQTHGTFFLGFNSILHWNDLGAGR
jgi:hypothetical protein